MFTTINVRGTKFDVSNDMLKRMPYFEALLERWSPADTVIDRCPESFRHILDFLVYGEFREVDGFMAMKLAKDSEYYGLPDPTELILARKEPPPPPGVKSEPNPYTQAGQISWIEKCTRDVCREIFRDPHMMTRLTRGVVLGVRRWFDFVP